jgi:hypothetical protein
MAVHESVITGLRTQACDQRKRGSADGRRGPCGIREEVWVRATVLVWVGSESSTSRGRPHIGYARSVVCECNPGSASDAASFADCETVSPRWDSRIEHPPGSVWPSLIGQPQIMDISIGDDISDRQRIVWWLVLLRLGTL